MKNKWKGFKKKVENEEDPADNKVSRRKNNYGNKVLKAEKI
jgi:hypothetical protein